MSQEILPLAVWESGTNNNSIPANDNALRVEVALKEALSIADSEPGSPSERDLHIVGTSWGGFTTNNAVIYLGGTWYEFEAFAGWFKTIAGDLHNFDGASWNLVTPGGGGSDVIDVKAPTNVSGTVTLDFAWKSRYAGAITLGANVTALTFANLPGAGKYAEYELHIKQDAAGSRTFAIPASHKALGGSDTAIASAVSAVTVLTASTVDNGTTWRYAMQESA